jgi:peptidoglycan hydrolase CwlO-like protein
LSAGLALGCALAATRPAQAVDLETIRARAQAAADQVSALEHDLSSLEAKKSELDASITEASQALGTVDLERQEADARYQRAVDRYVDRAVMAYMNGPSSDLALILSAGSIPDMYSVAQALGHAADEDVRAIDELIAAREDAETSQAHIDARKQDLLAARAQADAVSQEIGSALAERRSVVADLASQIDALEAQAREAAEQAAGASSTGYAYSGGTPADELLALLGPAGPSAGVPEGFARTGITFEGTASWYGPGFEGNHTASGDVFDSSLYTAASKELPLHSYLYVEHEGRGVVVLINDRGPYVGDRILDLSHAAAQAIGISGLGWIEAEVLITTN